MGSRNKKRNTGKQAVIMPKRKMQGLVAAVTIALIVVLLAVWWFIDMRSFVATVAGRRISTGEFKFYMTQEQKSVENSEGLASADEATRAAFWSTPVNGEDPVQRIKNNALDNAKELKIQIIKANALGLKVDEDIRQYVAETVVAPTKDAFGDSQYAEYIKSIYGVSEKDFIKVLENLTLADRFRTEYLKNNFTVPEFTDDEMKAVFETEPKRFDERSMRYIFLSTVSVAEDGTQSPLSAEDIKKKEDLAADILSQIKAGGNMEELAKVHSESPSVQEDGGLAVTGYQDDAEIKELMDWAFSAELNQPTIVKSQTGVYVARVEDKSEFEDVQVAVKSVMADDARIAFYNAELEKWMADSTYNLIRKDSVLDSIGIIP